MENTDPRDLALARIRVALDEVAPEIPDDEIVPAASLTADLRLDEVSIWALITTVERLAKTHINDDVVRELDTVGDLIDVVATEEKPAKKEEEPQDLASAAADLASLFNGR